MDKKRVFSISEFINYINKTYKTKYKLHKIEVSFYSDEYTAYSYNHTIYCIGLENISFLEVSYIESINECRFFMKSYGYILHENIPSNILNDIGSPILFVFNNDNIIKFNNIPFFYFSKNDSIAAKNNFGKELIEKYFTNENLYVVKDSDISCMLAPLEFTLEEIKEMRKCKNISKRNKEHLERTYNYMVDYKKQF